MSEKEEDDYFKIAVDFEDTIDIEPEEQDFTVQELEIEDSIRPFINEQIERYKTTSLSKEKRKPLQINGETGEVIFEEGTLIHCAGRCDYSKLKSISEKGIISGDFLGIPEDGESFYCADFYRADKKMNSTELFDRISESDKIFCRGPFGSMPKFQSKLAFIIEPRADLQPLLDTDMYKKENENHIMQTELNLLEEYKTEKNGQVASIPYGLPAIAISGIIAGDDLLQDEEYMNMIKEQFSDVYILTRDGKVFFDPELSKRNNETIKKIAKEDAVIKENENAQEIVNQLQNEKEIDIGKKIGD